MSGSRFYFGSPAPRAHAESRAKMHGTSPHMDPSHEHASGPDNSPSSSPDVEPPRQQASIFANIVSKYGNKSPYPFGLPGRGSLVSRWSYSDTPSGERTSSSCDSHEEYDDGLWQESMPHHGSTTSTPSTSLSNSPRSQRSGSASSEQFRDWLMPRSVSPALSCSPKSLTDSTFSIFEPLPPPAEARPLYTAWSPGDRRRLRHIRHALSMPDDARPEAVEDFLARNPSVVRHLASGTVAHPDWALGDDGVDGAEVRVGRDAADRNLQLHRAIAEVSWQGKRIFEVLDMAAAPTGERQRMLRVECRKWRRDTVPRASFTRMLDDSPKFAMETLQRRALAKEIRGNRPGSLLKFSTGAAEIEDQDVAQDTPRPPGQDPRPPGQDHRRCEQRIF